jgi:hypothetical protein
MQRAGYADNLEGSVIISVKGFKYVLCILSLFAAGGSFNPEAIMNVIVN